MRQGFRVISRQQLKQLANETLKTLRPARRASLVLLFGNLGSGKTTFVQTVAEILGVREKVLSPTFVFIHEHQIRESRIKNPAKGEARRGRHESGKLPFRKLIHADAYRIETKRDFTSSGVSNYLKDPVNLILVEWGDKIAQWLPRPDLVIEFRYHTPRLRQIRLIQKPNIKNQSDISESKNF